MCIQKTGTASLPQWRKGSWLAKNVFGWVTQEEINACVKWLRRLTKNDKTYRRKKFNGDWQYDLRDFVDVADLKPEQPAAWLEEVAR